MGRSERAHSFMAEKRGAYTPRSHVHTHFGRPPYTLISLNVLLNPGEFTYLSYRVHTGLVSMVSIDVGSIEFVSVPLLGSRRS